MSRARTAAGFLVLSAVLAAIAFLYVRDRGGAVAPPRGRAEPEVVAPTLLQGRAPSPGTRAEGPSGAGQKPPAGGPDTATRREDGTEARRLEGTVTGWDGKPSAGIEIYLVAADEPAPPRQKGGNWSIEEAKPNARTDESGHYVTGKVPPEWAGVVVARVSSTYEVRSAPVRSSDAPQRVDFTLPPPATLRVRLTSATREDLRLRQLTVSGEFVWFDLRRDEDGPWGLREEQGGRLVTLRATPGRVTVQAWVENGPMVEREALLVSGEVVEVEVSVPGDGVVRGRVLHPREWQLLGGSLIWDGDHTVLGVFGEDGLFRLTGGGHGRGRLHVSADFLPEGHVSTEVGDLLPDGDPVEVRIERRRASLVAGRVVGPADVRSLPGELLSRRETWGLEVRLDDDGRFEVPFDSKEPALFILRVPNMAPVLVELPVLAPGERRDVGFLRPGPGLEVSGQVRNGDGQSVAGVEVVIAERWAPESRVPAVKTDVQGVFRLSHLPERPLLLRFRGGGFPQHLVTLNPGETPKPEIVLKPGGTAAVRVVDADGLAVPGASLVILPAGDFPYDADFDSTRFHRDADAEGRASLRMCSGSRRLLAYANKGKATSETVEITIREGETTEVTLVVRDKAAK